MSTADAAWLHMDRPTNLMVINSVLLFDEPVDWDRVRAVIQTRLVDRYPRFHQRVVESRLPLRPPTWEEDPDFALEHHVHRVALPSPGDPPALQELVSDLMTQPLDRSRPLWHQYLVDGYGSGAAMIVRMHHCIADGIALARVMLSLTDSEPQAGVCRSEAVPLPARGRVIVGGVPVPKTRQLNSLIGAGTSLVRQGLRVATSPSRAARLAGAVTRDGSTLLRLVLTPSDPATPIKGEPRVSRRVAWSRPLSLEEVKRTGRTHDATVNDVLLAAVSGGLRRYLQDRGGPVAEIQAMVPFNLRPLDKPVPRELGNKFGLVMLPLPVGTSDSYRRLVEVHKRMNEIKASRDGAVSYGFLSALGMAPEAIERRVVDLFSSKGTAVMTNVPGPTETVYLAGTPVSGVLVWAPTSGHIGISLSIFSYRGKVVVGLMVDAALVPKPARILTEMEREVTRLGQLPRADGQRRRSASRQPHPARS